MLAKMIGHLSRYSGASLLLTIASMISFPVLTRVFTVEQYGLLAYVGLALTFLVGIAKLGMQHAAVRFRSEVETNGQGAVDEYVSTVVFGMVLTGVGVTLLWAVVSQVVPDTVWNHPLMKPLLLMTSVLVALRCIESAFINLLMADEKSGQLAVFTVVRRYIELTVILITLFFVSRSLVGFYAATITVQVLGLAALIIWYCRGNRVAPSAFSGTLLRKMLAYSIPMIGFELASVVLSLGDRYVIQRDLGAGQLGVYSAAYNLSDYIKIVLVTSVISSVMPVYLRLFEQEGKAATRDFLQKVLHFYLLLAVPVVLGVMVVGAPLLEWVASSKYADGASIIPWVMAGMLLEGLLPVVGAALYIQKRSKVILGAVVVAATVNIVGNIWLVPPYGIDGAAWTTFGSYGLMLMLALFACRGELGLSMPWRALATFIGSAVLMDFLISGITFDSAMLTVLVRVVLGAMIYAGLMVLLDRQSRELLPVVMAKCRAAMGTPGSA